MKHFPIPKVLECMYFQASNSSEHKRTVLNYEFDLYLDGKHTVCIDGIPYEETSRCLIFRKPGQNTKGIGDYNMYTITLDFSGSVSNDKTLYRDVVGDIQPIFDFDDLNEIPAVFPPFHFEELKELLEKLSRCSYPGVVDLNKQQQYIKEFLLLALHDSARYSRKQKEKVYNLNYYVKRACDFIGENFDKEITVEQIANELHINKNYFIKLFKNDLGQTPGRYILETRLIRARYLIMQTDRPISEIAYTCGFNTPSYFAKCFQTRFNLLPSSLRQNQTEK